MSAPTFLGHHSILNVILQTLMKAVGELMELAATPNQHSSGLIPRCSTATIDNDIMSLMLCPSALSAPTLMGYLYAYNSILQAPTTMRRVDVVCVERLRQSFTSMRCVINLQIKI